MLIFLRKEWRYFLLALGFFTRIPVPSFNDFKESELNKSVKYFPLIGCIVGFIGLAAYYIAGHIFPHTVAVLMSMAATIFATGAFHEDGLADSADGLGGGWQREQVLTIMQDSRLGTYGAVALFFALMAKFQLLTAMHAEPVMMILICAHALSRLSAVWMMTALTYAKADINSSGKAKPLATEISRCDSWLANLFGLLPLFILLWMIQTTIQHWQITLGYACFLAAAIGAGWFWWLALLQRKLGGYTGDTLGAIQQISEIMFYLATLAWLQFLNAYYLGN